MKKITHSLLFLVLLNSYSFADFDIKKSQTLTLYSQIQCDTNNQNSMLQENFQKGSTPFVNCSDLEEFDSVITKASLLVDHAPKISLFIEKEHDNASFDMGEIIYLPMRLYFSNNWGQRYYSYASHRNTILAHEYGHALFSNKLGQEEFFRRIKSLSNAISQKQIEIQKANSQGINTEELQVELEKLNDERLSNKDDLKLINTLSPFHELYADLIAVFSQKNKRAMVNALYYDEMSDQSFNLILARDFDSNQLDLTNPYQYFFKEEHGVYAPVRRLIGEKYWTLDLSEQKRILNALYTAIINQVLEVMDFDHDFYDPITTNNDLIEKFEAQLN